MSIYQESGYGGLINAQDYNVHSPYSIILSGDHTDKISRLDIIRIKDAITSGVNGMYHVLNVFLDGNNTVVETIEKINKTAGEGKLFFATYEAWRKGGPDNIVFWNASKKSWEYIYVTPGNAVNIKEPMYETKVYSESFYYEDYVLQLPLKLKLKIIVDRDTVSQNNINLETQRDLIKLEVAKYLQLYLTGTDIIYYPSTIIEFVTEPRRLWIKGMVVTTTDSSEISRELKNGIETLPEATIRDNISNSKLEILKYTSAFYWWDVDNIIVEYELNS